MMHATYQITTLEIRSVLKSIEHLFSSHYLHVQQNQIILTGIKEGYVRFILPHLVEI